jgi:tetratricopeptide (TPR) repeat protein
MDLNSAVVVPGHSIASIFTSQCDFLLISPRHFLSRRVLAEVRTAGPEYFRFAFWGLVVCIICGGLAVSQDQAGQALKQAFELHQSGHYAEAIDKYKIFLKVHPEVAGVRSNLGAALAHEGRYTEAVSEYKQALEVQPSNLGIRLNLALAYYKMSELDQAVKEFESVYSLQPPDDPERRRLVLLLSECYLRQGQDEKVIAMLDSLADTSQEDLTLEYLLGTALLHEGHEQRGAMMIERILRQGDSAEAHMLMAYTHMQANDKKGASEELDRALALNPNLPEARALQGRIAFLNSDLKGAEAAFRKALDLDPNSHDAQLWLGTLLRQQGSFEESQARLERALQLRPKDAPARYQFALLCSDRGDDKRAASLLEALIQDAPEYIEAHRSLSAIYFRLGRTEDGRKQRKIAEALDAAVQAQDLERGRRLQK